MHQYVRVVLALWQFWYQDKRRLQQRHSQWNKDYQERKPGLRSEVQNDHKRFPLDFYTQWRSLTEAGIQSKTLASNLPFWTQLLCSYEMTTKAKKKYGKRKVQGMPQSQTAALPRHQDEEKTDKSNQAQIEQTFEKH